MPKPETFIELIRFLHDKTSCREFLERNRWNGTPVCPHCKHKSDKHYKLHHNGVFDGLYKCRVCRKRFTVTVGTMFEGSKVSLDKWFLAIYEFLRHKKGVSSTNIARLLNVTQKTAWFMLVRIRYNLQDKTFMKLSGLVQMDETYIGGRSKGRIWQNQGRSLKQKVPVVGLLTHDKVYALVTSDTSGKTLKTLIYGLVEPGSTIVTDGWRGYRGISNEYHHEIVAHNKGSYVNKNGFHTNGIESFWSQLKRGILGVYHVVSPKHLQGYCNEFAYRYNTRKITDMQRFMDFIIREHSRIRYAHLIC